jgi:ribosomal protein S18 acetylase RimI-like enzyme
MSEQESKRMVKLDPACVSAVAALEDDPFYRSICGAHANDASLRRPILAEYFAYSIQEGADIGRCGHLEDRSLGVAVWLLPQALDVQERATASKRDFLGATLDARGCANYDRIIELMHNNAARVVGGNAWYLSIVAVDPAAQGRGLGRKLLAPTLAEADSVSATCFLETFSPRNIPFYERLGFSIKARFAEPTTGADYAVMARVPSIVRTGAGRT